MRAAGRRAIRHSRLEQHEKDQHRHDDHRGKRNDPAHGHVRHAFILRHVGTAATPVSVMPCGKSALRPKRHARGGSWEGNSRRGVGPWRILHRLMPRHRRSFWRLRLPRFRRNVVGYFAVEREHAIGWPWVLRRRIGHRISLLHRRRRRGGRLAPAPAPRSRRHWSRNIPACTYAARDVPIGRRARADVRLDGAPPDCALPPDGLRPAFPRAGSSCRQELERPRRAPATPMTSSQSKNLAPTRPLEEGIALVALQS